MAFPLILNKTAETQVSISGFNIKQSENTSEPVKQKSETSFFASTTVSKMVADTRVAFDE